MVREMITEQAIQFLTATFDVSILMLVGLFVTGVALTLMVWFLVQKRSRIHKDGTSTNNPVKLPEGRIGFQAPSLIGELFRERIILCAQFNIAQQESNDILKGSHRNQIENMWEGYSSVVGLRDLLDGFCNVESMPQQGRSITQAIPFEHIAIMREQNLGIKIPDDKIKASYLSEFEPLVAGRLNPRLRHLIGHVQTSVRVFFGTGIFLPEPGETVTGEVYFEIQHADTTSRVDLVLDGSRQPHGPIHESHRRNQTLAGFYRGQSAVYFTDQPSVTPVCTSQELGLHRDYLYAVGILSPDQQAPMFYRMDLSKTAKELCQDPTQPLKNISAWPVVDSSTLGFGYQAFDQMDEAEHAYRCDVTERVSTEAVPKLKKAELVIVPNTAYCRLREDNKSVQEDPHCELLGIVLPPTWPAPLEIQSMVIKLHKQEQLVSNPLQIPEEILFINRNRQVHRHSRDEFHPMGSLRSARGVISENGYQLTSTKVANNQLERAGLQTLNSFLPDQEMVAFQTRQTSLPSSGYWFLSRDEFKPFGYIGLPLYPGLDAQQDWSTESEVCFSRKRSSIDPENDVLLDWLDHTIELELDDPHNGGTMRTGYARWLNEARSNRKFQQSDRQLEALVRRQVIHSNQRALSLSESKVKHIPGNSHELRNGDVIRLGPLLVRYCFNAGQAGISA